MKKNKNNFRSSNLEDYIKLHKQTGTQSESNTDNGWIDGNEGCDDQDLDFINQYLKRPDLLKQPSHDDLPNGNYNMKVVDVWLNQSSQGIPLLYWKLVIVDHEEYNGLVINRFNTLKNEQPTMKRFFEDLSACGCEIQSADDIYTDEFKHQLIGIKILVEVCRKNGQIVCYFKKRQFNG